MNKLYTLYFRENYLKKITTAYCNYNTIYYKQIIVYNKFDQPVVSEEWIHNEDGTTHYQKEKIPYISCFGELVLL